MERAVKEVKLMKSANVIFRALAIAAFISLTIGGSASANIKGSEPVYQYAVDRATDINVSGSSGSGAGGSVASWYTTGTEPFYQYAMNRGTNTDTNKDFTASTGSGSGAGGQVSSANTTGTEPVYQYLVGQGMTGSTDNSTRGEY